MSGGPTMDRENTSSGEPLDAQLARMEGDRDSIESERMRLELRTRMFGEAAAPTRIDRFIVLRRLGAGGMGVVYAAYDPQLERNVALKLVRTPHPTMWAAHQQRLLREARALARLSHPNVIAVFEAGAHGRDVFIAMELVEGSMLDEYSRAPKRSRGEIIDAYLQAGAGLAAAHDAGLVHCDFKPQNVLVGADGRVRVLDFGLVRHYGDIEADAEGTSATQRPSGSLTTDGAVLGTPAYMAPEQRVGSPATAASDQFAFCVALHESLVGTLPRVDTVGEAVELARRGLPRRIKRVLARGMSFDAARRWPSMRVLLHELRRAANLRPLAIAGVLATGVVFASTVAIIVREDACPDRATELDGVWDGARAAELGRVLNWDDGPLAQETARLTVEHIDAYAQQWVDAKSQACRAHHVDRTESADLFDAKTVCLTRHRGALATLVDVLLGGDEATSRKAVEASLALPPVSDCVDSERLLARVPPPDDPAEAASIERLREELDRGHVLFEVGHVAEAKAIAASVLEEANALGYRPLQAEAAFAQAIYVQMFRDWDASWAILRDAAWYAEAGGDDEVLARILATQVGVETTRGDLERAHETARRAQATIERLGPGSVAEYLLHGTSSDLARAEERFADSAAHAEAALRWARETAPGSEREAGALQLVGWAATDAGDYERAQELLEAALELQRRRFGELNSSLVGTRITLAAVLERQGRWDEAAAVLEDVIEGITDAEAWDAFSADPLVTLSYIESQRGRHGRAIALAERAVAMTARAQGEESDAMVACVHALALAYQEAGRGSDARQMYERAGRIADAVGDLEGRLLASANIAEIDLDEGKPEQAAQSLRKAIAQWSEFHEPDHPVIGEMATILAQAELALGEMEAARASIERAVRILSASGVDTPVLAKAKERRDAILAASKEVP